MSPVSLRLTTSAHFSVRALKIQLWEWLPRQGPSSITGCPRMKPWFKSVVEPRTKSLPDHRLFQQSTLLEKQPPVPDRWRRMKMTALYLLFAGLKLLLSWAGSDFHHWLCLLVSELLLLQAAFLSWQTPGRWGVFFLQSFFENSKNAVKGKY